MVAISERIDIDMQQVWQSIGYDADSQPPARMSSLVDEYVEYVNHLVDASYSYVIRDVMLVHGSTTVIDGSIIFQSDVIARLLERCEKVAIFALTIGNFLEETAAKLAEDRLVMQAAVLDAVGSAAAEKVADLVQERISGVAKIQGLCTSRRFSPGYCDWDVDQQKMVFRALKDDLVGISLTEGCLMSPRKSLSGIIGIGPCDNKVESYNPCSTCDKNDNCQWRR